MAFLYCLYDIVVTLIALIALRVEGDFYDVQQSISVVGFKQ